MSMTRDVDYWQCKCGHVSLPNYQTKILPGVCRACSRRQEGSAPFVTSPRHGFRCDRVPSRRGPVFGFSVPTHGKRECGAILDCVYEMAEQIATGNGWPVDKAISQVLKDEGWVLLPTQRKEILNRVADDRIEYTFLENDHEIHRAASAA